MGDTGNAPPSSVLTVRGPTKRLGAFTAANDVHLDVAESGIVRSVRISATSAHLSVHENVRVALQLKAGLTWQFRRSRSVQRSLDARADGLLEQVKFSRSGTGRR